MKRLLTALSLALLLAGAPGCISGSNSRPARIRSSLGRFNPNGLATIRADLRPWSTHWNNGCRNHD